MSIGRIQAMLAAATSEVTMTLLNMNFDFALVKNEAPWDYQTLRNASSQGSKGQADPNLSMATDTGILPDTTRYAQMLIDARRMPWIYNVIASAAQWILLAGYLVIPGTFTSLPRSGAVEERLAGDSANEAVLSTIQNPPLLAIACVFFITGAAVLAWLYWEWRENYIWLISRIFMPVAMNAAAGLVTTLVNIYTARSGVWSVMALFTVVMTGTTLLTSCALALVFKCLKLKKVEEEHEFIIQRGIVW